MLSQNRADRQLQCQKRLEVKVRNGQTDEVYGDEKCSGQRSKMKRLTEEKIVERNV